MIDDNSTERDSYRTTLSSSKLKQVAKKMASELGLKALITRTGSTINFIFVENLVVGPEGEGSIEVHDAPRGRKCFVTLKEAASLSGTPIKTLYAWKSQRKLPEPHRKSSGRRPAMWDWDDLGPTLAKLTGIPPKCPPR